jgi:hypothetical protein
MPLTTGVLGRPWRADVSSWGRVTPWDGSGALDWYVAAEDRWHVPSREPAVRQHRVDGTAVVETRVRVPHGDVVHRVYSVADAGGMTVIEVENDSPSPIAVAFDRRDVRTERPITEVPIEGIELPPEAFVLPVGHRASARIALAHDDPTAGPIPSVLPAVSQVVRGWTAILGRAGHLALPATSSSMVEAVAAQRCELLLGDIPHGVDDPAGFVVAIGELVRLGESADAWLPELADSVAAVARDDGWHADAALSAAGSVLYAAGERRALADLRSIIARRRPAPVPSIRPDGVLAISWLEQHLARDGDLLPLGFPPAWLGADFDVAGVPLAIGTRVSFAVRWHGERPAVLWETHGEPVTLRAPAVAPAWSSESPAGEALWPAAS